MSPVASIPATFFQATNAVSRKVAADMVVAPRTPLWMFVPDHYDTPAVSNLLARMVTVYSGDEEKRRLFQSMLSGEYKRWLDDAREAGAIEY